MAKKITVRLDDETANKIDELSRRTHIPKVRLTKQAYDLLLSFYKELHNTYREEVVDINFIDLLSKSKNKDSE